MYWLPLRELFVQRRRHSPRREPRRRSTHKRWVRPRATPKERSFPVVAAGTGPVFLGSPLSRTAVRAARLSYADRLALVRALPEYAAGLQPMKLPVVPRANLVPMPGGFVTRPFWRQVGRVLAHSPGQWLRLDRRLQLCVRRAARRQVLHAYKLLPRSGELKGKRKHMTPDSLIRCTIPGG